MAYRRSEDWHANEPEAAFFGGVFQLLEPAPCVVLGDALADGKYDNDFGRPQSIGVVIQSPV